MDDLADCTIQTLREDGEFVFSRVTRPDGSPTLLMIAPTAERPTPASIAPLIHAHSLRDQLDPRWAVRPVALTKYRERLALLCDYPGGEFLDRLTSEPMAVEDFLRQAIGIAVALGELHRRGLVHRDVKPANLLVKRTTGEAWLMGFGLVSRLARVRHAPAPPEVIAGTLAYMAPEQTGRMNRSIDARSDLYAMGVTFYEMLTGALPFAATDPMGWIHSHIARPPVPLTQRVDGIPGQIEAIVLKLLAKAAEDRYQTAAGAEADLRRCLEQWSSHERVERFPLGARDVSDLLLIPETLYDRETAVDALTTAFNRVVNYRTTERILVSGGAGVGKSALVHELHKSLVPQQGLFAAGKFDQYKRDIPYATLAQAFEQLVRQLLSKSAPELDRWRQALQKAVHPNGQLMVGLIPELALIIGEQPPVAELLPQETQSRFVLAFRHLLGAFARPEHPLVLFLDDMQWVDPATVELIEQIVNEPEVGSLLVICAYRDNEVDATHPLARILDKLAAARGKLEEIRLGSLSREGVTRLVSDALRTNLNHVQDLAELVFEKTGGNPFFVRQFLTTLADERLVAFDSESAAWRWNLERIRTKDMTDNVAELMATKLRRLPDAAQTALARFACLGSTAQTDILAKVLGLVEEEVHLVLADAVRMGFISGEDGSHTFLHDRVQEAAYALIPASERPAIHIAIGRTLEAGTSPENLEDGIFEIINHLSRGAVLITDREELDHLAALNLLAGKRAKASTAYASALAYFSAGCGLLTDGSWERRYRLIFDLKLHRAECEYLTGNLEAAKDHLLLLAQRAANSVDAAAVTCVRINLYTQQDRSDLAVEVGLQYLAKVGLGWSLPVSTEDVLTEYESLQRQLNARETESLIDLPVMSDPIVRATMEVLTALASPALFTNENIFRLVVGRMVTLSVEHGNCDASCLAYAWMGGILGPHFGDYRAGSRFGRLGVELVEKQRSGRFAARVYAVFAAHISPWTEHVPEGRVLVQRAFVAAREAGDPSFIAYSYAHLIKNLLLSGESLDEVQRQAEDGLQFARKMQFGLIIDIIAGFLGIVRMLRGLTHDFGSFNDAEFDESNFEHHLEADPRLALATCWYWVRKLQARFVAGDYESAIGAAEKVAPLLWTSRAEFELADYHFFGALARAATAISATVEQRREDLDALHASHQQMTIWAAHCPENFADRAALLGAEIARLEGREVEAERLYEEAIRFARTSRFVQNEGLASELAAEFHAARGLETVSRAYLRNARSCFLRWGALGKVQQLDQNHAWLLEEVKPLPAASTKGALADQLDVETVVRASQALSSEIVLPKLIENLMRIAVEHAGADRGLLILLHGDESQIEAEAITSHDVVSISLRQTPATSVQLPESLLRYVLRTQDSVILDDATKAHSFASDEYFNLHRQRSILALPLLKHAHLVGVLYLENSQTPHAFTPARISVLRLLASQAAISLENARLYTDLRDAEGLLAEAQRIGHTGSWAWNIETSKLTWSAEQRRIFGFSPDRKLAFDDFAGTIHPEDRSTVLGTIDEAARVRGSFDHEFRIVLPDGTVKFIHGSGRPVVDDSGSLVEYFGAVTDITNQKKSKIDLEEALAKVTEAKDQFQTLIETIPCSVWTADASGAVEYFSRSWLDLVGMPLEEMLGYEWANAVHPDDLGALAEEWQNVLVARRPAELEGRVRQSDGSYRRYLFRAVPLSDANGNVVKWYGTNIDVEDIKRAEKLLAGEKKFFEMIATGEPLKNTLEGLCQTVEELLEGVYASILLMDEDRKRLRLGASPSIPRGWSDAIDGSIIGPAAGSCGTSAFLGEKVYVSDIANDPLWVDYRELALSYDLRACWSSPIFSSDRSVLGAFAIYSKNVRDITPTEERMMDQFTHLASIVVERNRAEDALRKSEAFLADGQKISHTGSWAWNLATDKVVWSDEHCRIFGYRVDEVGGTFADVLARMPSDESEHLQAIVGEAIAREDDYHIEYQATLPDGSVKQLQSLGRAIFDRDGKAVEYIGTTMDVTERKRMEDELIRSEAHLRKVQAELAHVARITTMGELAASIAHEVSQPLTGVAANAKTGLRWLDRKVPDVGEAKEAIQRALRDGKRANEVIERIRKLFRKDAPTRERLDINEVVQDVISLTNSELNRNSVSINLRLATDAPSVLGDRVQIQQVLMNLILNAIDAMSSLESDTRRLAIDTFCEEGGYLSVAVQDSGVGIPLETSEQIFEPFHTSKEKGLGMGLAICRTIVEGHGGRLRVTPVEGPGARFEFTLQTHG